MRGGRSHAEAAQGSVLQQQEDHNRPEFGANDDGATVMLSEPSEVASKPTRYSCEKLRQVELQLAKEQENTASGSELSPRGSVTAI